MKHHEFTIEADANGILRIEIPGNEPNKRYLVSINVSLETPDEWPEGFIEKTAGKWVGEFPDLHAGFREYYSDKRNKQ